MTDYGVDSVLSSLLNNSISESRVVSEDAHDFLLESIKQVRQAHKELIPTRAKDTIDDDEEDDFDLQHETDEDELDGLLPELSGDTDFIPEETEGSEEPKLSVAEFFADMNKEKS